MLPMGAAKGTTMGRLSDAAEAVAPRGGSDGDRARTSARLRGGTAPAIRATDALRVLPNVQAGARRRAVPCVRLHRRLPTMVQPTPGGMARLWKRFQAQRTGAATRCARQARGRVRCPRQDRRNLAGVPGHDAGRRPVHREDSRERHSAHRGAARDRIPDRRRRSRRHHRRAGHDSVAERAGGAK